MVTKIELDEMRKESFKKLKTNRLKFNGKEIFGIIKIMKEYRADGKINDEDIFVGVVQQIERDVKTGYKKYDSLCMWLDSNGGLSIHEPELIKRIAIEIGGLKEVNVKKIIDKELSNNELNLIMK